MSRPLSRSGSRGRAAAFLLAAAVGCCALPLAAAAARASEDYRAPFEGNTLGGGRQTSASYTHYSSIGGIGAVQTSPAYTLRGGPVGQITLPPGGIALSEQIILEQEPLGAVVGNLSALDPEFGEIYSFEIVAAPGGDDHLFFTIADGQVRTAEVLHYPTRNHYSLRLRAIDTWGLAVERVLAIEVEPTSRPVVLPVTLERLPNLTAKIEIATLLAAANDPSGGPVFFQGVSSTSQAGGQVFVAGGWVLYLPPPGYNANDSFAFSVQDGRGVAAAGEVSVVIRGVDNAPTLNVSRIETLPDSGNQVRIRFVGVPGRSYAIQATSDLTSGWTTIATRTADASGLYEYIDEDAAHFSQRFYRAVRQ